MLDPVGPLPASVYWRRRALALAAVILVLLLGWALLPGGGDDQPRDTAAAAGSPSATVPAAAPTTLSATPPAGDPGRPADGNGGTGTGATPATPVPTTPTPTPPPVACADSALRLTVAPRRPAYSVGQSPILVLRVQNLSTVPCVRDLGAGQQEVQLFQGAKRLWSSNDCYPDDTRDVQVLRPGAQVTSSVTWSGLGSRPQCAGTRTRIGAGGYTLVARLGTLVSPRAPIVLR